MVGPFIFFDQMGPAEFLLGQGIDVRPHPHIGLSTVTYLFDGEIMHRDSLGTEQAIRPGELNWMTAGRGIVHSERTAPDGCAQPVRKLFGIQSWVALPAQRRGDDARLRASRRGSAARDREPRASAYALSPGRCLAQPRRCGPLSQMFYADVALATGAEFPSTPTMRSARSTSSDGTIDIAGDVFERGPSSGFPARATALRSGARAEPRFLLLGGEPMDGPRHIWWNFVSSPKERIEQAKADWRAANSISFRATASSFPCRTGCPAIDRSDNLDPLTSDMIVPSFGGTAVQRCLFSREVRE